MYSDRKKDVEVIEGTKEHPYMLLLPTLSQPKYRLSRPTLEKNGRHHGNNWKKFSFDK